MASKKGKAWNGTASIDRGIHLSSPVREINVSLRVLPV